MLAGKRLRQNASGDYSPDVVAARFPAVEAIPTVKVPVTVDLLLRLWEAGAQPAPKTVKRWSSMLRRMAAFVCKDDVAAFTQDDMIEWREHRLREGIAPKTVEDADLAGPRSMINWAIGSKLPRFKSLSTNPLDGGRRADRGLGEEDRYHRQGATEPRMAAQIRQRRSLTLGFGADLECLDWPRRRVDRRDLR
jgi:hypothetical protein